MIEATCRDCGTTFEPSHEEILAGVCQDCPACRAKPSAPKPERDAQRCELCGRSLRAGKRNVCAQCMEVAL